MKISKDIKTLFTMSKIIRSMKKVSLILCLCFSCSMPVHTLEKHNEAAVVIQSENMSMDLDVKTPPNIIFIMADDHTTQGFGVYGSCLAKLNPIQNIDRLAHEGMLFENVFCTNSICTPSRASIMTGQYGHVNGVHDLSGFLTKENQKLPLELKELGYQTAMVGK